MIIAHPVSLKVDMKEPGGISHKTVRDVSENCRTLQVTTFGIDEYEQRACGIAADP